MKKKQPPIVLNKKRTPGEKRAFRNAKMYEDIEDRQEAVDYVRDAYLEHLDNQ